MNPQQPIPYVGSKTECKEQPIAFPPQHQNCQPGLESLMSPRPISEDPAYRGSGKLDGKIAIVTGGTAVSAKRPPLPSPRKVPIWSSHTYMRLRMRK